MKVQNLERARNHCSYRFALYPKFLRECRVPQTVFQILPWQIKIFNTCGAELIYRNANTPQICRTSASFRKLCDILNKNWQTPALKSFSLNLIILDLSIKSYCSLIDCDWLASIFTNKQRTTNFFRGK